jgi:Cd2+/Zn2+-exporting ATPase
MIGRHGESRIYRELFRSKEVLKCLCGVLLIPVADLLDAVPLSPAPSFSLGDALFLASLALNGLPIVVAAGKGLLAGEINVDELVGIALVACLMTGSYAEGAIVAAIMVFGALLEEAVSDKARDSIRALVAATPDAAVVERDGVETAIEVREVRRGDVLVIRAGDAIPVDGTIVEGATSVNEASITGESIPADRMPGEAVYAGTACVDGFVRIRADRVGEDSAMGRIIRLVETAERQKTDGGRIVDKYAAWFTPAILAIAAITWLATGDMARSITVLIVGCPCAFLLASPVSAVAAIGRAARSGILVKGGKHLENVAAASAFFFDKTGTLTFGQPEVVEIRHCGNHTQEELIGLAAAVEQGSLHPLGVAIVKKAESMRLQLAGAAEIHTEVGHGISGRVGEKRVEVVASRSAGDDACTAVDVLIDGKLAGTIGLLDKARETAARTVRALREEGIDDLVIVSGDRLPAVRRIAEEVGIAQFFAAQKPREKLARIGAYAKGKVVYVGDGINDAPALKAAATGVAMGMRGVNAALETADVVLMNDRLDRLPFLVRLGRRMSRTIRAGILLSLAINLTALAAGSLGFLTPILGAITHNAGALLVVSLAASLGFTREA